MLNVADLLSLSTEETNRVIGERDSTNKLGVILTFSTR
jgi:hypothetical protein